MNFALLILKDGVMTASPVLQWPIELHALVNSEIPSALKISPHTPPPYERSEFAALTMHSVSK